MELVLDIKSYMYGFDEDVWIKMVIIDEKFKEYAYSKDGVNQFIKLFYKEKDGKRHLFGKLHSIHDLPAIINEYGSKYWYYNNKLHRANDLPAIIYSNGEKYWYRNGKIHRENDMPAIINNENTQWWVNGLRHRKNDLPAIIHANGDKEWYYKGKIHRKNNLPLFMQKDTIYITQY